MEVKIFRFGNIKVPSWLSLNLDVEFGLINFIEHQFPYK